MVKISERLRTAAGLIGEGERLADVGTDHGYVPIYLVERKHIPSAIAMDIRTGPLERAREHIRMYGMEDYIQTRLSDGVAAEHGSPDELYKQNGIYTHMTDLQKDTQRWAIS